MKQCPRCQRIFGDDRLRFCRSDGTPLVSEVSSPEDAPTLIFPSREVDTEHNTTAELVEIGRPTPPLHP